MSDSEGGVYCLIRRVHTWTNCPLNGLIDTSHYAWLDNDINILYYPSL